MSDRVVVIGLGSPLMGDDGLGLVALEQLREGWHLPGVDLVDGGTWGMSLLPVVEGATHVLFLDAIHAGAAPGEIVVLEREAIPRYFAATLSPHQVDLKEMLAAAELRGTLPAHFTALGMEPARVALGTALSPVVEQGIEVLVAAAVDRLMRWGVDASPRFAAVA